MSGDLYNSDDILASSDTFDNASDTNMIVDIVDINVSPDFDDSLDVDKELPLDTENEDKDPQVSPDFDDSLDVDKELSFKSDFNTRGFLSPSYKYLAEFKRAVSVAEKSANDYYEHCKYSDPYAKNKARYYREKDIKQAEYEYESKMYNYHSCMSGKALEYIGKTGISIITSQLPPGAFDVDTSLFYDIGVNLYRSRNPPPIDNSDCVKLDGVPEPDYDSIVSKFFNPRCILDNLGGSVDDSKE